LIANKVGWGSELRTVEPELVRGKKWVVRAGWRRDVDVSGRGVRLRRRWGEREHRTAGGKEEGGNPLSYLRLQPRRSAACEAVDGSLGVAVRSLSARESSPCCG
jgi:hypothetical protein